MSKLLCLALALGPLSVFANQAHVGKSDLKEHIVNDREDCDHVKREVNVKGTRSTPKKYWCDKVSSKSEVENKISRNEEKRIFKCISSIATNRKDFGIAPFGDKKFEIMVNSPLADEAQKEHLVVDSKSETVKKCKYVRKSLKCENSSWSHAKDVLKENIAMSKVKPLEKIDHKYKKKKEDLTNEKADYKNKKSFLSSAQGDDVNCIVEHVEKIKQSNPEQAQKEKQKWMGVFGKLHGKKIANWDEVKKDPIKKSDLIKFLDDEDSNFDKKLAELPAKKEKSKEVFKKKLANIQDASKNGKKLCSNVGFASLAEAVKKKVDGSANQESGRATSSIARNSEAQ
jgi:hypothetical protein